MNRITISLLMLLISFSSSQSLVAKESQSIDTSSDKIEDNIGHTTIEERRASRGLSDLTTVYVPRGQWVVGFTGSFTTHQNDGYTFVVIDDIHSQGHNVKVSPMFAYSIKDNMALGGRFSYGSSKIQIDAASVSIGDEESGLNLSADDYYGITNSYSAIAIWRQYIPLGKNRRFALFNEFQLEFGGTTSKFTFDSPVKGTYAKGFTMGLGIAPGITAFATKRIAAEVSVGVLGLSYSKATQTHNQVYVGDVEGSMMNLKINIFSVGMGVSYYF